MTKALPFFPALNPFAQESGISYSLAKDLPCQGKEMVDLTLGELWGELKLPSSICTTHVLYMLIVGQHYDLNLIGKFHNIGGAKGILDFLILPLVARKLIADFFTDLIDNNLFLALSIRLPLALFIAVPLEIARVLLGITMAIVLTIPFIIGNSICKEPEKNRMHLEDGIDPNVSDKDLASGYYSEDESKKDDDDMEYLRI